MRKLLLLVITAALGYGGFQLSKNYKIEGLDNLVLTPRDVSNESSGPGLPQVARDGNAIRVASFNIQVFGESKLAKPRVRALLVEIVRQFDIVAIQEIRSQTDIMPRFVDELNATGRHYDYVVGPRLGRSNSKEQYA